VDPITLAIEAVGLIIQLLFIIVPIGEFKQIFRSLRSKRDI
jgi:hypothetical protein